MKQITFHIDDLKIKFGSEEIDLLPKEFQLFHYLYNNQSRLFTREELLDTIWAMETPTDRTVDDHIYRIRKKLKPWFSCVKIDTVRGQGYRLTVNKEAGNNPLLQDEEVSSNVKALFQKYHRYGHGEALKLLEVNQSIFGFELDHRSQMYLRFMKGEFQWFVEIGDVSFWEKCYYLLHIYSYIQKDKEKALSYFEKALQQDALPEIYRVEMEMLNRLNLLLLLKQLDKVEQLILQFDKFIKNGKEIEGYILLFSLSKLYFAILKKDVSLIEKNMTETEMLMERLPFLRERASFLVAEGI